MRAAGPPRVTIALTAVTALAFLVQSTAAQGSVAAIIAGFIPARLSGMVVAGALPMWITPLTATLVHASLLHLGFNLLMLWFCGQQDEVAIGWGGVAILYLVGAYAAAGAQYALLPHSVVPMIGASGAISALVGAYALLYGKRQPSRLPREWARWAHIGWLAVAWIAVQFLVGLASATTGIMVATAAHVGGFVAGLLLARPLLRWRYRNA